MSDTIIRVNSLSKRYRFGAAEKGNKNFREAIMDAVSTPIRNFARLRSLTTFGKNDEKDVIWALKDISFEVKEGEVLGIIGRNGAGKTTLLKILSRITEPTDGSVEVHGRLSSLLEVGTGFHPELTGRENIFLNGAILGMRKKEIERKFDDIVNFSEIGRYIDTPVKRYSSGMYVRLAFAVAAHLEPEVLLVDEVLAVGDIAFQRKCLGKMEDIARGGRTVLFISHNMGAIRSLCGSVIWLDNGQIVKRGVTVEVVRDYEDQMVRHFSESSSIIERKPDDVKNKSFFIRKIDMLNTKGEHTTVFRYNDKLILIIDLFGYPATAYYNLEFRIFNELDQFVTVGSSAFHGILLNKDTKKMEIEIGPLVITSGKYTISLSTVDSQGGTRYDNWDRCCRFDIIECEPFGFGHEMPADRHGVCILQQTFREIK
jgi:lipopolysaccharide transport system ATP-binding protein